MHTKIAFLFTVIFNIIKNQKLRWRVSIYRISGLNCKIHSKKFDDEIVLQKGLIKTLVNVKHNELVI